MALIFPFHCKKHNYLKCCLSCSTPLHCSSRACSLLSSFQIKVNSSFFVRIQTLKLTTWQHSHFSYTLNVGKNVSRNIYKRTKNESTLFIKLYTIDFIIYKVISTLSTNYLLHSTIQCTAVTLQFLA